MSLKSESRKNEPECNISEHQNLIKMHAEELKYKNDEHVDEVQLLNQQNMELYERNEDLIDLIK